MSIKILWFSLTALIMLSFGFKANSQVPSKFSTLNREITGKIVDSTNNVIIGAIIKLVSAKDTMTALSNSDGIFFFRKVKMSTFVLTITELGYLSIYRRYFFNDATEAITLEPIMLSTQNLPLKEVVINGKPSIIYKNDTVEYKASDYKVRDYAPLNEMLKKMEGMEVASDGTLAYQGQSVLKARLNGKDYAGGDVAQAIKNLPADIVEKVQIIDEYDDQADKTGIKNGEATKVLNITTKADRSIGNLIQTDEGYGNNNRYNVGLFSQYLNANQEAGIIGNLNNTLNGVAANNSLQNNDVGITSTNKSNNGSGYGGTITSGASSLFYRDQLGKKIQINFSYSYNFQTINSLSNTNGQQFSTLGTIYSENNINETNKLRNNTANIEFDYAMDNDNFLRIIPRFSYSSTNDINNSQQSFTGLTHFSETGINQITNTKPNIGSLLFFSHSFKNKLRNVTAQVDIAESNNQLSNLDQKDIIYYNDSGPTILKDSLQKYLVNKNVHLNDYKALITYVEPMGFLSQLEFTAKIDYKRYNSTATTDSINIAGDATRLSGLNNIYNYVSSQTRIGLAYSSDQIKYNYSIGVTVIPYNLNGSQDDMNKDITLVSNIYFIPIFRFQYIWSPTQRFSLNYSGQPLDPSINQLQPFVDKSDPQNIVVGNPLLKPIFYNSVISQYNNYIVESKTNITVAVYTSVYSNQIIQNVTDIFEPALNNYLKETFYVNAGRKYSVRAFYNLAKQLNDRKYILSLLGRISYNNYTTMSNSVPSYNTSWKFNEKLSMRLMPVDWIEVNPYLSYDINRTFFNINNTVTNIKTTSANIDGRFFLKTWVFGYSATKNYINGIVYNITKNPFVVNAYFEKQLLKAHNLIFNIQVFDLFHQNNYVTQTITGNSITDIKTNSLSRYFMASLRLNLQRWNGAPAKNGIRLKRKGDGSFIYQ